MDVARKINVATMKAENYRTLRAALEWQKIYGMLCTTPTFIIFISNGVSSDNSLGREARPRACAEGISQVMDLEHVLEEYPR